MASAVAAKLLESLDEKVAELREAVQTLTDATDKMYQDETGFEEVPEEVKKPVEP